MNSLNSIILEGEITEDVKLSEGLHGAYARFEIDSTRTYKNAAGEEATEVSTFPVIACGNIADFIAGDEGHIKYGLKGQGVRVVGRLKLNKWTDKDGKKWSEIVVIAEHIEFKPFVKKETA